MANEILLGILLILIFFIFLGRYIPSEKSRIKQSNEQYGIISTTTTGTLVKSYKEKIIAEYFTKNNIRYEYESVVYGGNYNNKIIHPDFYLPEHNVYVEYWGLVDIPDIVKREEYVKSMRWKMAQYHKRGINFISLYPNNLNNLEYVFPMKFKQVTGRDIIMEDI